MNLRERIEFVIKIVEEFGKLDDELLQLANKNNIIKLGSLTPTRDFNFVKDTAEAFIAVAESSNTIGEIINSASNFEISIGETQTGLANMEGISIPMQP